MKTVAAVAALGVSLTAAAAVEVSGIYSSNMVLQRGRPVPVWGKDKPGAKVTVSFNGASVTTTADAKGAWTATLPKMDVLKEGRDLSVKGTGELTLTNVVVGDVWLVSGQSNSEMPFAWGIIGGKETEETSAQFPNIRSVKFNHTVSPVPMNYVTCNSPWVVADAKTLKWITAMGYYFARDINGRTGIPIGIVDDNRSGWAIEPFVPEEGMRLVKGLEPVMRSEMAVRQQLVDWCRRMVELADTGDGPLPKGETAPKSPHWGKLYNAQIAPIVRFPIAGALWYQGCTNGSDGLEYADKLMALAGGWRAVWGYDFPFYIVQLASFTAKTTDPAGGNGYARIRNAQRIAAQSKVPNAGLVVTIDIGNAADIHPKNKRDVGERLARWARRDVYGEKNLVVSGPLYREMKAEGGKIRLSFDHVGSGLAVAEKNPDEAGMPKFCTGEQAKLKGFAVAGEDKVWQWADAVIDGEDVVVSSDKVAKPVAVRYAHRANPMGACNLYNKEGLPASPFRTDSW